MAGKGGGAWKVAYADFVTAMMAFFMVMWLTSQKPEIKESIGSYFQDPWAQTRLNSNTARSRTIREVSAGETNPNKPYRGSNPMLVPHDQPESPDYKQPRIVTVRASERTTTGAVVIFEDGNDQLSKDGERRIRELLPNLIGLNYKVEVRGHASPRETYTAGDLASDWNACYARSLTVLQFLRENGIDEARLRLSQASGYEPLTIDSDNASQNVRVEINLLDETVDSLQGTPAERSNQHFSTSTPSGVADDDQAETHLNEPPDISPTS